MRQPINSYSVPKQARDPALSQALGLTALRHYLLPLAFDPKRAGRLAARVPAELRHTPEAFSLINDRVSFLHSIEDVLGRLEEQLNEAALEYCERRYGFIEGDVIEQSGAAGGFVRLRLEKVRLGRVPMGAARANLMLVGPVISSAVGLDGVAPASIFLGAGCPAAARASLTPIRAAVP